MTQTAEEKLVELAKAYSKHRKALRNNAKEIRDLLKNSVKPIDLAPIRAEYLDPGRTDLVPDEECIVWKGWAHAVDVYINNHEIENGHDSDMMRAARLLDAKKEINAQGARIRNRLRIIGDQLLMAEL